MKKLLALCLMIVGCSNDGLDAAEYRIMVFSATYCEPCRRYEPVVKQLQAEGWPILLYKDQHELAQSYGVTMYPTTVVVDSRNTVAWKHVGYIDLKTAREYLNRYKARIK